MLSLSNHLAKRLTALGLTGRRHFGGDLGQLGALTAHDATDKRRQGVEVTRQVPCGLQWIGVGEGVADGTITAHVVTHRVFLLVGVRNPDRVYDKATSQLPIS